MHVLGARWVRPGLTGGLGLGRLCRHPVNLGSAGFQRGGAPVRSLWVEATRAQLGGANGGGTQSGAAGMAGADADPGHGADGCAKAVAASGSGGAALRCLPDRAGGRWGCRPVGAVCRRWPGASRAEQEIDRVQQAGGGLLTREDRGVSPAAAGDLRSPGGVVDSRAIVSCCAAGNRGRRHAAADARMVWAWPRCSRATWRIGDW